MIDNDKENNGCSLERPTNWTKGYAKQILNLVNTVNMLNEQRKLLFKKVIDDLYKLSQREYMNEPLYFFSRRQKATVARIILDELYEQDEIEEAEYKELKEILTKVMLENFSRQILPEKSGVIPAKNHKTEAYMNYHRGVQRDVLEPREYIGIVPEAVNDLDAPSLVTALTPPQYEQPRHDHANNREITFYAGPSIGKYKTGGQEFEIQADFGDFILFPPKTWHTIKNPTDEPVRNISVKLPSALLDRGKEYHNAKGSGSLKKMKDNGNGDLEATFEEQDVPYKIKISRFGDGSYPLQKTFEMNNKSLLYVLDGMFVVNGIGEDINLLKESDVIVLDKNHQIKVDCLSKRGDIYIVELQEGRQDESLA